MIASINIKRTLAAVLLCGLGAALRPLPAFWLAIAVCLVLAGLAVWEYDAFALPPLPRPVRRRPNTEISEEAADLAGTHDRL
jgi:hypothetical protein